MYDDRRTPIWVLYVELMTRVTTVELPHGWGCEKAALDSIFSAFSCARKTLHATIDNGLGSQSILKIMETIRPLLTKWHVVKLKDAFDEENHRQEFRLELVAMQTSLKRQAEHLRYSYGLPDLRLKHD